MAYAVARTDRLMGTDVNSMLESVKFYDGNNEAAIENGNVVAVGDLLAGEREIKKATAPAGTETLDQIVLIVAPEVNYDDRKQALDEFRTEAGFAARGYHLHHGDIFSVTEEALANASPAVGQAIKLGTTTKWDNVAAGTSGALGKIIAKDVVGRYTYYAIQID